MEQLDKEHSSTSLGSDFGPTFADWFLDLPGRDIFIPIPISFLEDEFNLYDVHSMPNFDTILEIILENEPPSEEFLADPTTKDDLITFYELVHQKYIITKAGLIEMVELTGKKSIN